jgi:hypothetical protein
MAERRRLSIPEAVAQATSGILDDTITMVRPSPEELKAMRAEAETFLAARRAGRQPSAPARRHSRRRTPA